MIKILEGPLRDVEKLANQMEPEGWTPLGAAQFTGVSPTTGAKLVILTVAKGQTVALIDTKYTTWTGTEPNFVGGGDE